MVEQELPGILRLEIARLRRWRALAWVGMLVVVAVAVTLARRVFESAAWATLIYFTLTVCFVGFVIIAVGYNKLIWQKQESLARAEAMQPSRPTEDASKSNWAMWLTFVGVLATAGATVVGALLSRK